MRLYRLKRASHAWRQKAQGDVTVVRSVGPDNCLLVGKQRVPADVALVVEALLDSDVRCCEATQS